MKIFITGSKGFIGRELVLQCQKQGMEVLAADLPEANICSKDISRLIPEGIDAVVHLAALSRDSDCKNKALECFDINVTGTLNLIRAAEEKKVKQFIFASSEWVYDNCTAGELKNEESFINIANHKSEYALSKLVSEANLRQKYQNGFCPVTILRFGIVYGPRKDNWSAVESLFNSVKTQGEIKIGSLKTGRCFIYVSDIASGIIKSLGLDGFNIINLEGEKMVTLKDVIEVSKEIFGKNPEIVETAPDNPSVRNISSERAKKILNWEAQVDLKTGLKSLLTYGK